MPAISWKRITRAGILTESASVSITTLMINSIGYVKASNTDEDDSFGFAVSLSADGNTLAVGAFAEGSNATGIGGDQTDSSAGNSGAVYVFSRSSDGVWGQQPVYIKASNTGPGDNFGRTVSLSADGNTLAVGALFEGSNATGIGGNQTDNSARGSGAVYVFSRNSGIWSEKPVYVKASNAEAGDQFGRTVSLSADGETLAVGAIFEDSNAIGIDGDPADNSAPSSGAVYVFSRSGGSWSERPVYVKASNTGLGDWFGYSVRLSADGNILAVGAPWEGSNATGQSHINQLAIPKTLSK